MALHRDIHWIGRQWAVTGFGLQVINQKHGGAFDIEIARLWDDGLLESLREQKWLNAADFEKGLAIARKRYPGPPQKSSAVEAPNIPQASPVEPQQPPLFLQMRTSARARFLRPWHIRFK
jgi:hypothetical protein